MEKILNNLTKNETLHTTAQKTKYLFIKRAKDGGIVYSINKNSKTLPIATIKTALSDFINKVDINAEWYKNYDQHEYKTRSCNLSVLKNLLNRL